MKVVTGGHDKAGDTLRVYQGNLAPSVCKTEGKRRDSQFSCPRKRELLELYDKKIERNLDTLQKFEEKTGRLAEWLWRETQVPGFS
jgi:hypothetical protein